MSDRSTPPGEPIRHPPATAANEATDGAAGLADGRLRPHTRSRRDARVLVADDNAATREPLVQRLVPHWTVATADDGAEAIGLMEVRRPDLVVTPLTMPGLGGFLLLDAMRRDPALADVPVIMLSPSASEEARINGLERGADEVLAQPFSPRELIARIDAHLCRAEAGALRKNAEKSVSSVFENAPIGVALLQGPEHRFEYSNREHNRMAGERPLLGIPFRTALPELAGQGFYELLDDAFSRGVALTGRSMRTLLRHSPETLTERYFDFIYQPLHDASGRVTGTAIVSFDVTCLNEARREAESANRTKDEFLEVLGHELRNPLAPIVTALHLMQMRGIQGLEREHEILDRQVGHLVRLVDDLLDVARIFGGRLSLRKVPVSLQRAVTEALSATAPLFAQKHLRVTVDMSPSGLDVLADGVRLTQILSNLLTHAARYTPADGQVRIGVQQVRADIVLVVEDQSADMDPAQLSRLFENFFETPQRTDRADGGLGLGLAIARALARQHGGDLTAATDGPGRGSRFTLTLPALPALPAPPDA